MDTQKIPTEEELKQKLSAEEYEVLREKGTEAPFSGKLLMESREGTYRCKVCRTPLFTSDAKFETNIEGLRGWPSFEKAIPGSILKKEDSSHGMRRIEFVCATCGSHLGHIFPDEKETKTGEHYCVNSVCLEFEQK